jgi:hypothetical protein
MNLEVRSNKRSILDGKNSTLNSYHLGSVVLGKNKLKNG